MSIPLNLPNGGSGPPGSPGGGPASPHERPAAAGAGWTGLAAPAKRERLLVAAGEVFARRGLDARMSEVADAAGSGVASVYRIFPSKRDLLAALVTRRMEQLAAAAGRAREHPGSRWEALADMLRALVERQSADDFMGEARMLVADHPDVVESRARAWAALERVVEDARAEGRLRPDASTLDLRLLFAATRAARRIEPEQWPRMLELMIDALDTRPRPSG